MTTKESRYITSNKNCIECGCIVVTLGMDFGEIVKPKKKSKMPQRRFMCSLFNRNSRQIMRLSVCIACSTVYSEYLGPQYAIDKT